MTVKISKHKSSDWYIVYFSTELAKILPDKLAYKIYPTHIELKRTSSIDAEKVARVISSGGNPLSKTRRILICSHRIEIALGEYTLEQENSDTYIINL